MLFEMNGYLKEPKISDKFGEMVSAGEKGVVSSGVLQGGI